MDLLDNYTNNLFVLLKEKLGARFKGSYYVNNETGFIRGFINNFMVDLCCYDSVVTYEINHCNDNNLRDELDNIIKEYIGIDDLLGYNAIIYSWPSNCLGSIFALNHRIDEKTRKK